jgi:hypothetical protein
MYTIFPYPQTLPRPRAATAALDEACIEPSGTATVSAYLLKKGSCRATLTYLRQLVRKDRVRNEVICISLVYILIGAMARPLARGFPIGLTYK